MCICKPLELAYLRSCTLDYFTYRFYSHFLLQGRCYDGDTCNLTALLILLTNLRMVVFTNYLLSLLTFYSHFHLQGRCYDGDTCNLTAWLMFLTTLRNVFIHKSSADCTYLFTHISTYMGGVMMATPVIWLLYLYYWLLYYRGGVMMGARVADVIWPLLLNVL
jgi:hypothetical protein